MLLVDAGGLHLRGQPLCHQLEDLGAKFLKTCKSSPGEGLQSHPWLASHAYQALRGQL